MAFGQPERITFIADPYATPVLIDAFGKGITFNENKDGTYTCTVKVPEFDMERFAMENWDLITVTSPDKLVRKLSKNADQLQQKYNKTKGSN